MGTLCAMLRQKLYHHINSVLDMLLLCTTSVLNNNHSSFSRSFKGFKQILTHLIQNTKQILRYEICLRKINRVKQV